MTTSLSTSFPYYWSSNREIAIEAIRTGTVAFDTNALLDFYKYSEEATRDLLKSLESIKDRVFVPHRVAEEFLRNRMAKIRESTMVLEKWKNTACSELDKYTSSARVPMISDDLVNNLRDTKQRLQATVDDRLAKLRSLRSNDWILATLNEVLDGRVGAAPAGDVVDRLTNEAEARYKRLIPPGYADAKKTQPEQYCGKCIPASAGDYLIWQELLSRGETARSSLVLITNETKEDWLNADEARPRRELFDEFRSRSGDSRFAIVDSATFFELVGGGSSPKPASVHEVQSWLALPRFGAVSYPPPDFLDNRVMPIGEWFRPIGPDPVFGRDHLASHEFVRQIGERKIDAALLVRAFEEAGDDKQLWLIDLIPYCVGNRRWVYETVERLSCRSEWMVPAVLAFPEFIEDGRVALYQRLGGEPLGMEAGRALLAAGEDAERVVQEMLPPTDAIDGMTLQAYMVSGLGGDCSTIGIRLLREQRTQPGASLEAIDAAIVALGGDPHDQSTGETPSSTP